MTVDQLELIPTLAVQRELYARPRDPQRFRWYLDRLMGDARGHDVALPIAGINPMGREHCLAAVEALIGIDAEAVVRNAIAEASRRLGTALPSAHVALNLLDDVAGGWTNRYLNEAELRLGSERGLRSELKNPTVIVACWASEHYTPVDLRLETMAALYRHADRAAYGVARTLRELLRREGYAIAFADPHDASLLAPALTPAALAATRRAVAPHLDATAYPTLLVCCFGDAAAEAVGYPSLGVGERAGFALALADARDTGLRPEQALRAAR